MNVKACNLMRQLICLKKMTLLMMEEKMMI